MTWGAQLSSERVPQVREAWPLGDCPVRVSANAARVPTGLVVLIRARGPLRPFVWNSSPQESHPSLLKSMTFNPPTTFYLPGYSVQDILEGLKINLRGCGVLWSPRTFSLSIHPLGLSPLVGPVWASWPLGTCHVAVRNSSEWSRLHRLLSPNNFLWGNLRLMSSAISGTTCDARGCSSEKLWDLVSFSMKPWHVARWSTGDFQV